MTDLKKTYLKGTHRLVAPAITWERLMPKLGQLGITRVADITGMDHIGIPVFQAIRPNSRTISVSQGKGSTVQQAMVGAVMESIEGWHASDPCYVPGLTQSLKEMRYSCPYDMSLLRWMPGAILFDSAPIPWLRATRLFDQKEAWVPRQLVEMDFRTTDRFRPIMFVPTTNGLASGNCYEEALIHALCEVIERDALAKFEHNQLREQQCLNLDSVYDPLCRDLLLQIKEAGISVTAFYAGGEQPVPVFLVDLFSADIHAVCTGSGCHPVKEIALSRAITEAVQSRATYLSATRDDIIGPPHEFIFPSPEEAGMDAIPGELDFTELPSVFHYDFSQDLHFLTQVIHKDLGAQAYAVDLTRPDVEIPVCYVLAPGLRESING